MAKMFGISITLSQSNMFEPYILTIDDIVDLLFIVAKQMFQMKCGM